MEKGKFPTFRDKEDHGKDFIIKIVTYFNVNKISKAKLKSKCFINGTDNKMLRLASRLMILKDYSKCKFFEAVEKSLHMRKGIL